MRINGENEIVVDLNFTKRMLTVAHGVSKYQMLTSFGKVLHVFY